MNKNKNEYPIFIDNQKKLNFKIKDINENLESLRVQLGDIIPYDHVFKDKNGPIDSDDEEIKKVSEILIDGCIYFKSQNSIKKDQDQDISINSSSINVKALDLNGASPSVSFFSASNTVITNNLPSREIIEDGSSENNVPIPNLEEKVKKIGLMNINVDENRKSIIDYCKNLPLKYSIDSETFQDKEEILQWDIKDALIFPPNETLTFITKSTFNSVEHNAHKGGLYTWNGSFALKFIADVTNKGSIETDNTKSSENKTVYSYTHGMVSRLEIRIDTEHIKLKDSFINALEDASSDLKSLKLFLKSYEYFPTKFVLGGKICSTAFKRECKENEKESFGFALETRFKTSFHDCADLELGAGINKNKLNQTIITGNYSFDEKKVYGGDSTLKDDFENYILSLEKIQNCSIIEIGNICSIFKILKNQNRELYDKCSQLLINEEKTFDVKVLSCAKTEEKEGFSKFIINNNEIDFGNNKGFNIVLVNSKGCNLESKSFNTSSFFFFINRSKNLVHYLNSIKDGTIVLISVNGDGFSYLSDCAKKALESLGIEHIEFFESQTSLCCILTKGDKQSVKQNSNDSSVACVTKTFKIKN